MSLCDLMANWIKPKCPILGANALLTCIQCFSSPHLCSSSSSSPFQPTWLGYFPFGLFVRLFFLRGMAVDLCLIGSFLLPFFLFLNYSNLIVRASCLVRDSLSKLKKYLSPFSWLLFTLPYFSFMFLFFFNFLQHLLLRWGQYLFPFVLYYQWLVLVLLPKTTTVTHMRLLST